jgi:DNA mismatch repair protein MutL
MGHIHVLDDQVINKIAAGEVVERPASVVKELVENALDAGANQIDIVLDQGGVKRIVVTDNGHGMDAEDAILALKRHATSKLQTADDLFNIGTMGFRGEALASIASVSHLSLATTQAGLGEKTSLGLKLIIEPDQEITQLPWQGPVGTTVAVEDLFYNLPARSKFLRSLTSEYSQCLELIQALALCNPQCGFSLTHNGREQFRLPSIQGTSGEEAMRQRARGLFTGENIDQLIYVSQSSRHGKIEMLASPPGVEKASGRYIFTSVNGRWVKDKTLRYGILRGYHSHLLKGRFPFVICHLHLDPALVDVNVHPAKAEVRFQYAQDVQSLIAVALREAIRQGAWAKAPLTEFSEAAEESSSTSATEHLWMPTPSAGNSNFTLATSPTRRFESSASNAASITRSVQSFQQSPRAGHLDSEKNTPPPEIWDRAGIDAMLADMQSSALASNSEESIPWADLEYIGAFDRCFLLFAVGSRLLVLDQHAFHERILFEHLSKDASFLQQTQRLLMPESVELSPIEVASLSDRQDELASRGFVFLVLSETLLEVNSIPALLMGKDLSAVFASLAATDTMEQETDTAESNIEMSRLILATIACHGAVRAGEELGEGELKQLLSEAQNVDFYHNCPHGRRVFRWWTRSQVAQWFDR